MNNKKSKSAKRTVRPGCRPAQFISERFKYLLILVVITLYNYIYYPKNPLQSVSANYNNFFSHNVILLYLFLFELTRQIHFFIAERNESYWSSFSSFTAKNRLYFSKLHPNTRRSISGTIKFLFLYLLIATVVMTKDNSSFSQVAPKIVKYGSETIFGIFAAFAQSSVIVQVILMSLLGILQFVAIFWFMARGGSETYYPSDIKTRFSDVWGQDHVLDSVKEVVTYLEEPDEIEGKGGYVPGGILLYGPPGTGKTLIAEAIAGETGKPYVFVEPGAFQNMFMGVGILRVRSLFKKLRKLALKYDGVIVFFDEADSLGNRGGQVSKSTILSLNSCNSNRYMLSNLEQLGSTASLNTNINKAIVPISGSSGGDMGALQALLSQLQGLKKPRGLFNRYVRRALGLQPLPPPKFRILTIMASNMPDSLDPALLRPGRIDRLFRVGYPSREGRTMTLNGYLAKVQHSISEVDIEKFSTMIPQATGATIKDMVNEALIISHRAKRDKISWDDLIKAKHFKELGPSENVEYVERERHAVAIHEASHAFIAYKVRKRLTIDTATIEKGSSYLGLVSSIQTEDLYTRWKSDYKSDICVALASLAGERIFFSNDSTSGVSGDLQAATTIAQYMINEWGMEENIVVRSISKATSSNKGTPSIDKLLEKLYNDTYKLLSANKQSVLNLAHALEIHKTLSGEDVIAVIDCVQGRLLNGKPYSKKENQKTILNYHNLVTKDHERGVHVIHNIPEIS